MVKEVAMQRKQKNVNRADYLQYLLNLKNKAAESSDINNGEDFASQKNSTYCLLLVCLLNHPRLLNRMQTEMADDSHKFSLGVVPCSI